MLYLEDYMEMIENLPMEMRDRFTEMREMDLQVQNAMDSLEDRMKKFFEKCHTSATLKQEWKDEHFKKLKEEYSRALEDADEKVHLTAQVYDLLERYLRKIDMEVQKFKLELEADNAGITERLEKRSLELDNPPNSHSHRGEKRKYSQLNSGSSHHTSEKRVSHSSGADKLLSLANENARENVTLSHRSSASAANSPAASMFNSTSSAAALANTPALSYNLGHVGAGSNAAIAAAASRAIGATLEMSQGRRTASLKASYEAVKKADMNKDFLMPQYAVNATGARSETSTPTPTTTQKKKKTSVLKSRAQHTSHTSQLAQQLQQPTPAPVQDIPEVAAEETSSSNWQVDPNEPRYCVCNDVSYGDMVGCDNDDCPIEWFHYGCVGLAAAPRGKWYCPQCTVAMKRRGRR